MKKHSTDHRDLEEAFMKEVMMVEKIAKCTSQNAVLSTAPKTDSFLHLQKLNTPKNILYLPLGRKTSNEILPLKKHCHGAQSSGRRHL